MVSGPAGGMVDEEREMRCEVAECSVGCGSSSDGFVNAVENGPVGVGDSVWSSGECFRKYKRRKRIRMGSSETEFNEGGKFSGELESQIADKFVKEKMFRLNSSSGNETIPKVDLHDVINVSDDCSLLHRRNIILKHMHQSLNGGEGVMKRCIQDALAFHPDSGCAKAVKESVNLCDDRDNCPSQTGWVPNEIENVARGNVDFAPDVSLSESNRHTLSELCQRFFFEILISENFAQLCNICLENFQGVKVGSFLDISLIDSRMKEGVYGCSPMLFRSDIQQIWTKIQKFGTDIVALAKSLSEKSMTFSCEKVGGSVHSTSDDGKDEFVTCESDQNSEPEQTEACGVYGVCTCSLCGDNAETDCLVCRFCEERFHISCIEPAVEEIPVKSWYCTNCTNCIQKLTALNLDPPHENCVVCERLNARRPLTNGDRDDVIMKKEGNFDGSNRIYNLTTGQIESPHENCVVCERLNVLEPPTKRAGDKVILRNEGKFVESTQGSNLIHNLTTPQTESRHGNCVVCERLNAPRPLPNADGDNVTSTSIEKFVELEESSNGLEKDRHDLSKREKDLYHCNMCRTEVVKKGKKFRVCAYSLCPHRFYHVGCLTKKQLKSYGPSWYCPSCLCRSCHSDQDYDKVVRCHVCDRAYHIFCMIPPCTKIPTRKWFCRKCDKTLQRIREVRTAYENELKKGDEEGKGAGENYENGCEKRREKAFDYSCGVDMLLNAAKTLNYEENLVENR